MFIKAIGNGYEIRELNEDSFWEYWDRHAPNVFGEDSIDFMWRQHISVEEKEKMKSLGQNMGTPLRICLGVFKGEDFVGWSAGDQLSSDVYYMRNSGVLPVHRRRGIYAALVEAKLEMLRQRGFQRIYSRHVATNNAVIIPKLKAGFIITSLEIDDMFGTLVHLSYYTNSLRRKMMDFRAGQLKPDEEMKKALGII